MDKAALGQKLRQARLDKGYTQQSLSEKADIGEVYLSEIERGLKMPSMNLFIFQRIIFSVMKFRQARILCMMNLLRSWIP